MRYSTKGARLGPPLFFYNTQNRYELDFAIKARA
jgi:hypothetical protein